jgi:hypothetical protein
VTTLAEIEAAAAGLSPAEKQELIHFLSTGLGQREGATIVPAVDLNQFAGVLQLSTDPLAWQQQLREEWK